MPYRMVVEFPYLQPGLPPLHIRAHFDGASGLLMEWEAFFPPKPRKWKLYPVPNPLLEKIDKSLLAEKAYEALDESLSLEAL